MNPIWGTAGYMWATCEWSDVWLHSMNQRRITQARSLIKHLVSTSHTHPKHSQRCFHSVIHSHISANMFVMLDTWSWFSMGCVLHIHNIEPHVTRYTTLTNLHPTNAIQSAVNKVKETRYARKRRFFKHKQDEIFAAARQGIREYFWCNGIT